MRQRHIATTGQQGEAVEPRARVAASTPQAARRPGKRVCEPVELAMLSVADHIPYTITHHFAPRISRTKLAMLNQLQRAHITPYNGETNPAHVALLRRLWEGHNRITFSEPRDFAAVDPHWTEMGFQNPNPASDFRGAGLFALEQLVYLVEQHPRQWNEMCRPDFPCAIAGINVTMRLITLLRLNTQTSLLDAQLVPCFTSELARVQLVRFLYGGDGTDMSEDIALRLHEVYCAYLQQLHQRWRRSSGNLMELNNMLKALYVAMERQLCVSESLEDFCARARDTS